MNAMNANGACKYMHAHISQFTNASWRLRAAPSLLAPWLSGITTLTPHRGKPSMKKDLFGCRLGVDGMDRPLSAGTAG